MNDQQEPVAHKLDALTTTIRYAAGIAPKVATRTVLGVALAIEDSATDQAGRLLGNQMRKGASTLASGIGSIASDLRRGVSSGAKRLASQEGPLSKVPVFENTRELVSQAMTEVRGSWESASHVSIQVEDPEVAEDAAPTGSPHGPGSVSSTGEAEEVTQSVS